MFLYPFQKEKNNKIPLQALNKQTFMIIRQWWHTPWAEPVWSGFETSLINTEFQDSQQNPISKYKYNNLNICPQTFHQRHSYQKKVKYILFFQYSGEKTWSWVGDNLGRAGEEKGYNESILYATLKNNEQGESFSQAVAKPIRVDRKTKRKTIKSGNTTRL